MQEHDARIDQLQHQLATLAADAEIAELTKTRLALENQTRDAKILVDDLTIDQKKADADVEQVKARRERDRGRMDQGLITNPKDLERMQHELVSLERRITTLEDEELEIMEKLEEAQNEFDRLTGELAATDDKLAQLITSRDEKAVELKATVDSVTADRATAAEGLPADLVTLYDKLRGQKGGVGAAALRARACGGCRLTLDNAELGIIKKAPSDEVIRCEECQRILVRTDESGL